MLGSRSAAHHVPFEGGSLTAPGAPQETGWQQAPGVSCLCLLSVGVSGADHQAPFEAGSSHSHSKLFAD